MKMLLLLLMGVVMLVSVQAVSNLNSSLVSCYSFDTSNGSLDLGAANNNLTFQNGAYIDTRAGNCKNNQCAYFNGSSYAISNETMNYSSVTSNSNKTISFWAKFNNTPSNIAPMVGWGLSQNDGAGFYLSGSHVTNELMLLVGGAGNKDLNQVFPYEFSLLTLSANLTAGQGTVPYFYANSTEGTGNDGVAMGTGNTQLLLGVQNTFASYFTGWIDELAIWNTSLNRDEILDYHNNYNGSCKNIIYPITTINNAPSVNNVSITPIPLSAGTQAKGHWNYSDSDGNLILDNETLWYINKSLLLTGYNQTFLNSPNVTLNSNITFSAKVTDSLGLSSNWVNSSIVTVGDLTAPTFKGNRTSSSSVTVDSSITIFINVTDTSSVVSSVIAEIQNPQQQKSNLSMSLSSGSSSDGEWSVLYPTNVVGSHSVVFYATDGNGNRANTGNELTFTANAASTPTQGGGGGVTTIIGSSNTSAMLYFGTLDFSFTIYSTPSSQERYLKFENRGNGGVIDAKIDVLGDASKYLKVSVCETPSVNCKTKNLNIRAGETAFLRMEGNFDRSLMVSSQGIIRITEDGNSKKTFDLLVSLDRPLIYGTISKLSNSEPYLKIFGLNELPALAIVYVSFILIVGTGFYILASVI